MNHSFSGAGGRACRDGPCPLTDAGGVTRATISPPSRRGEVTPHPLRTSAPSPLGEGKEVSWGGHETRPCSPKCHGHPARPSADGWPGWPWHASGCRPKGRLLFPARPSGALHFLARIPPVPVSRIPYPESRLPLRQQAAREAAAAFVAHSGQAHVAAGIEEGQLLMVEAQQGEDGGVDVVDVQAVPGGRPSRFRRSRR